jgi:hypothetical protein
MWQLQLLVVDGSTSRAPGLGEYFVPYYLEVVVCLAIL